MRTFIILIFFMFLNLCLYAQQNSVLSSGNWYKIGVAKDGIYRLSYNDFQNLGVNTSSLDVNSIKLYGNGGGMLPSLNSMFRYDDLQENAIEVIDKNSSII